MKKVNLNEITENSLSSPKGKFRCLERDISIALGRNEASSDWKDRHPFDLGMVRLPPGAVNFPYHVESAQWEHYHVVSGRAQVRSEEGITEVGPGDSFIFPPGEAHQITNHLADEHFVYYVIANNPVGGACYYPDSKKWSVPLGNRSKILREDVTTYFEGEE